MAITRHVALGVMVAGLLAPLGAQQAEAPTFKLVKIDAVGVHRYTAADVARVSGLTVGQPLALHDIATVASKMADTGLFKAVRYRYSSQNGELTVTFDVDEQTDWSVPVVFDNFVWMTDDELTKAVREAVPGFDGTAPTDSDVPTLITAALKGLLKRHNVPGDVDYKPFQQLDGTGRLHIFSVTNPAPTTCALHFDGAVKVPEGELQADAVSLIGVVDPQHVVSDFSRQTLLEAYQKHGLWRAAFQTPMAAAGDTPACHGVLVTLHVDEGQVYTWDHAEWFGNQSMAEAELNQFLGFKKGDLADGSKIAAGLGLIGDAYGRRGHLVEKADSVPVLDDAAKHAAFKITVVEGAQFHMGAFSVTGLAQKDIDELTKKWKLKTGDVYDADYIKEFWSKEIHSFSTDAHPLAYEARLNLETHVVDVVASPKGPVK